MTYIEAAMHIEGQNDAYRKCNVYRRSKDVFRRLVSITMRRTTELTHIEDSQYFSLARNKPHQANIGEQICYPRYVEWEVPIPRVENKRKKP